MRSVIDWNEIVPMLKKELRDTLMLEAVLLLSSGRQTPARQAPTNRSTKAKPLPSAKGNGERSWYHNGDGQMLAAAGRKYRINKSVGNPPRRGKIGAVWAKLIESKNDVITYEGIASICTGQKALVSATIAQLWERNFIEVEEKKVAVAY